jgi:hypothetical protein
MPHATHTEPVNASVETIWRLLVDKIENPGAYLPGVRRVEILERTPDFVLRRLVTDTLELTERIARDARRLEIVYSLVDHPLYFGTVTNRIAPPEGPGDLPLLTFTLDWREFGTHQTPGTHLHGVIRDAVRDLAAMAEAQDRAAG